jgi:hypothetical protein
MKLKHWSGVWGIFARKGSPVLEFAVFSLGNHRANSLDARSLVLNLSAFIRVHPRFQGL